MNMNTVGKLFTRDNRVYWFALICSLVLSVWVSYHNEMINPDGICYLLSAQVANVSSIKNVMHYCAQAQWPLYSTSIAVFEHISHLSYAACAHIINAIFSLLSVIAFILIVKELGGSKRALWLAALVILCNHQFNVLREDIIRDHGFWAFYLISFYSLLKYFREPKFIYALSWNAALIVATLFRIEGAIFLLVLPFSVWCVNQYSWRQRVKIFFSLSFPVLLVCAGLVLWYFTYSTQSPQSMGRVAEIINQLQNGVFIVVDRYQAAKAVLIQSILPHYSVAEAGAIVMFTWLVWYAYNVVLALSVAYAVLLAYAWLARVVKFPVKVVPVVWSYFIINVILTLVFLAENLFLSKRYLIALTLISMLWLPFILDYLIAQWSSIRHRVFLCVMAVALFSSALSGVIHFGHSKLYIRNAGDWIAENIPTNASLYINDIQLMYYSQHFGLRLFEVSPKYLQSKPLANSQWKQYDYLALRLNNNEKQNDDVAQVLHEMKNKMPLQVFSSDKGSRIVIYKT